MRLAREGPSSRFSVETADKIHSCASGAPGSGPSDAARARDGTPQARAEFLRTTSFGVLLVGVTVAGMLARYFWELFQSGRSVADADPSLLVMPLAVSLMVFYPLWTMVSGATRGFFLIVAAFQNGFFWQTLFSGLRPFP